jgi:hypothetical protein
MIHENEPFDDAIQCLIWEARKIEQPTVGLKMALDAVSIHVTDCDRCGDYELTAWAQWHHDRYPLCASCVAALEEQESECTCRLAPGQCSVHAED